MKLYYSPGACSLSPHIILNEVGAAFDLERVDIPTHKTASGVDYYTINPKGGVPTLALNDKDMLTEGAAIVQYIADQYPQAKLAPENGTLARAHLQEHLNYISAEVHKSFSPLFNRASSDEMKEAAKANVIKRMDYLEKLFSDGRQYLMGDNFSVADAYLFTVSNWTAPTGIGLDRWPNLKAFSARVAARPAVQKAMQAEGLTGQKK